MAELPSWPSLTVPHETVRLEGGPHDGITARVDPRHITPQGDWHMLEIASIPVGPGGNIFGRTEMTAPVSITYRATERTQDGMRVFTYQDPAPRLAQLEVERAEDRALDDLEQPIIRTICGSSEGYPCSRCEPDVHAELARAVRLPGNEAAARALARRTR